MMEEKTKPLRAREIPAVLAALLTAVLPSCQRQPTAAAVTTVAQATAERPVADPPACSSWSTVEWGDLPAAPASEGRRDLASLPPDAIRNDEPAPPAAPLLPVPSAGVPQAAPMGNALDMIAWEALSARAPEGPRFQLPSQLEEAKRSLDRFAAVNEARTAAIREDAVRRGEAWASAARREDPAPGREKPEDRQPAPSSDKPHAAPADAPLPAGAKRSSERSVPAAKDVNTAPPASAPNMSELYRRLEREQRVVIVYPQSGAKDLEEASILANGILTDRADFLKTAQRRADERGTPVVAVWNPSEGVVSDLKNARGNLQGTPAGDAGEAATIGTLREIFSAGVSAARSRPTLVEVHSQGTALAERGIAHSAAQDFARFTPTEYGDRFCKGFNIVRYGSPSRDSAVPCTDSFEHDGDPVTALQGVDSLQSPAAYSPHRVKLPGASEPTTNPALIPLPTLFVVDAARRGVEKALTAHYMDPHLQDRPEFESTRQAAKGAWTPEGAADMFVADVRSGRLQPAEAHRTLEALQSRLSDPLYHDGRQRFQTRLRQGAPDRWIGAFQVPEALW